MGRTRRKRLQRKRCRSNQMECSALLDQIPQLYAYLGRFGWRNETKLTVRCFPKTERGLCSKCVLHIGDVLLRLPIEALITIASLESDKEFKASFDESLFSKDIRVSFQCLLALYLLHHKHLSSQSHIEPFLNSLPKSSPATPYFCVKNELYCLPEIVLERTVAQNREIRTGFQNLRAVFGDRAYFEQIFSIDDFKWAYFVVNSRCVFLQSSQVKSEKCSNFFGPLLSDAPNLALAPLLDFFNHSAEVSTTAELLLTSNGTSKLEFVLTLTQAPVTIQTSYQQLFINYGALPNFKLLTDYGFVLAHNKQDFFEFNLVDIENFIKFEKSLAEHSFHRNKFKFIRDHNLQDQMFVHLQDGASHNLRVVLHLLFKEQCHYPNILNQVAFGDASQFEDVDDILRLLIQFKIREYEKFTTSLKKLATLSESGLVVLQYLKECHRFLEEFLASF